MKFAHGSGLVVVSAPSGTGKTSLDMRLQHEYGDRVEIVRSCTTRQARNQRDKDYIFVSREKFKEMIGAEQFLEWAVVFDNYYGTSREEVERIVAQGKIAVLEIDVQGGQQVRQEFSEAGTVFILPPSIKELRRRLRDRGTDTRADQDHRLRTAAQEIGRGRVYEKFVINTDLEEAYADLCQIVLHRKEGRTTREQGIALCNALLQELRDLRLS